MKKISILALLLITLFSTELFSGLKIDSNAPDILVQEWLSDAPKGDNPFEGKTVVLEFWATWCGPCVKAIPHINKLVDKYQNDDFIFVSLTKENKAKVTKFMKKKTMKAFVALDTQGKTNRAYRIRAIPRAFIITPDGKIGWVGHPMHLSDQFFDYYLEHGTFPKMQPAKIKKK